MGDIDSEREMLAEARSLAMVNETVGVTPEHCGVPNWRVERLARAFLTAYERTQAAEARAAELVSAYEEQLEQREALLEAMTEALAYVVGWVRYGEGDEATAAEKADAALHKPQ